MHRSQGIPPRPFLGFADEKSYLKGYYSICSKATLPNWKQACGEELPQWWPCFVRGVHKQNGSKKKVKIVVGDLLESCFIDHGLLRTVCKHTSSHFTRSISSIQKNLQKRGGSWWEKTVIGSHLKTLGFVYPSFGSQKRVLFILWDKLCDSVGG